jgi:hypothetical protein
MHQPPISLQISSASCWKLSNILGPCTTAFYPIYQPSAILYQVNDYLTHNKGPLDTYEDVMEWHLMTTGAKHEKLRDVTRYLSRPRLLLTSKKVQHTRQILCIIKPITLPSSKAYVRMVCNDASACLQSIMTDPRLDKADYLFGTPTIHLHPDNLDYIGDINSVILQRYINSSQTRTNRY